jgi:PiT family inorganic phosphate transporter
LFTLPAAGAVGALAALIAHLGMIGIIIDTLLGLGVIGFIFWRSRRNRVDSSNAIAVPDVAESGYAVRISGRRVRKVSTKTGTVPPLTAVAQSAVRDDKAAREAERRARAEREAAERAARKAAKKAKRNGGAR